MTDAALVLRETTVTRERGAAPVLRDVNLSIAPGERVGLVGLNGSGKTSLLMAVVGLVPFEGEILVAGTRVERASLGRVRDRVGFLFNVPEDQLLLPRVRDDVAFGAIRAGVPAPAARAQAEETLAALGVAALAGEPVHHLSHGQKQRVALAGALVRQPPLLLLDEPSAALDPPAVRRLAALLSGLPSAMLVATHDLAFAAQLCHRVVLLEEGRVVPGLHDLDEVTARWG